MIADSPTVFGASQVFAPAETVRVLHVGQDNLFSGLDGVEVQFIATGDSITPQSNGNHRLGLTGLARLLSRLLRDQRYDLIVLPVVKFKWPYDLSRLKRGLRWSASQLLQQRRIAALLNAVLLRGGRRVIAFDRSDYPALASEFLQSLRCIESCFKANLSPADADVPLARADGSHCRLEFLPYWLLAEHYPDPGPVRKDIDIFFAGAINSPQRREAVEVLERMRDSGYRTVVPTERMSFAEYLDCTARAWLTISPQGYGYNGFRHYEAMLMRSLPVINHANPPILHDFVDGENSLLYDPPNLRGVLESALADRERLTALSAGLREFALKRHTMQAVGEHVLQQLQLWPSSTPEFVSNRNADSGLHPAAAG